MVAAQDLNTRWYCCYLSGFCVSSVEILCRKRNSYSSLYNYWVCTAAQTVADALCILFLSPWLWYVHVDFDCHLKILLFHLHHIKWGISHVIVVETQKSLELRRFFSILGINRATSDAKMVLSKFYDHFMKLNRHCISLLPLKRAFKAIKFTTFTWRVTWRVLSSLMIKC